MKFNTMELPAQFIKTKLDIPPVRPKLVSRSRLKETLNRYRLFNLTLVSAPAGYGKTTLLSEWARSIKKRVGWISLDDGDNDLTRFWSYFMLALRKINPEICAIAPGSFNTITSQPIQVLLASLLNEIAEKKMIYVVVLDDYHVIQSKQVHDSICYFIDLMPPNIHIILSTRVDPPVQLSRLRVRNQLNEIYSSDLGFTADEAEIFFNHVSGLKI